MNSRKSKLFLCIPILALLFSSAFADRLPIESDGDKDGIVRTIPEGMVHIINSLNAKIFFSLSYDGEDWNEVFLDAMQSDVFEFANYIKISTQKEAATQSREYKLELSRRYRIVWNKEDELYDVVKLSID